MSGGGTERKEKVNVRLKKEEKENRFLLRLVRSHEEEVQQLTMEGKADRQSFKRDHKETSRNMMGLVWCSWRASASRCQEHVFASSRVTHVLLCMGTSDSIIICNPCKKLQVSVSSSFGSRTA